MVCVVATPDFGARVHVGGAALIPGECAAPKEERRTATWVVVEIRGVDGRRPSRGLRAPTGRLTTIELEPDRPGTVRASRVACAEGERSPRS